MRLIWIEDARVGDGWSAHLEDEPDTTLFIAPELHHGRYLLQGAFVPDSHEMSREYGTLAAAQEQALLYLTSWIARRKLSESRRRANGMKYVDTLSVHELCAEIREAPFYDDHADITPQQLRSAYERLHAVSRELVEWLDGSGDAGYALERVGKGGEP